MNPMPMIADAASERMVRRDMIDILCRLIQRMAKKALARIAPRTPSEDNTVSVRGNMQIRQIVGHGPICRRRPKHFVEPTVVDPAGNFELDIGPIMRIEAG